MTIENRGFEIRQLVTEADAAAAARVGSLAYTFTNQYSDGTLQQFFQWVTDKQSHEDKQVWGIFHSQLDNLDDDFMNAPVSVNAKTAGEAATLVAPTPGLIAHWIHRNFKINLFGTVRSLGGLAFVGVDMKHKKRGYAKVLVTQWLKDCFAKGQYLVALHPFRPDFYGNMGFGLSSPYYDYVISPSALPKDFVSVNGAKVKGEPSFNALKTLKPTHLEEMVECQNRYSSQIHGMIQRNALSISEQAFKSKGVTRVLGYRDNSGILRGYLLFTFETTTSGGLINDLKIADLVHETTEALYAFIKFLREQDDQIRYIKFTTQETDFFRLLNDPRSGPAAGEQSGIVGFGRETAKQSIALQYKVVNLEKLFSEYFADRDFNGVDDFKLWINTEDTFTPEMNPPVLLQFKKGRVSVLEVGGNHSDKADASMYLSIADFSALVVGAVSAKLLARYGKANVEPATKLNIVSRIFYSEDSPSNTVFF
ncbi:hypothetical protein HDU79_004666 [Rhizoclosmatium sp. JEL0117]|nr:hypothetical protein HDU79_004666 [Rhizoclosmatium sp. JEL0117]